MAWVATKIALAARAGTRQTAAAAESRNGLPARLLRVASRVLPSEWRYAVPRHSEAQRHVPCGLHAVEDKRLLHRNWLSEPLVRMAARSRQRKTSTYRSGRSPDWLKSKNPACEAVRREAEEDWGK
jgi:hypothetical protein